MSETPGIERRRYVRIPFSFILRYRAAAQPSAPAAVPKFYTASVTKNVSAGGLLFPATMNIPMGTELEIELNLAAIPQSQAKESLAKYRPVQVTGRVVRTEEIIKGELYNVGFVIEKIDDKEKHALEQFVDFFLKRERLRNKFKFGIGGKEYIGPERRKFIRVPYTFIVKYAPSTRSRSSSEEPRYCLNSNISACGILLETHEKFDVSTLMDLEMVIPNDKQVVPVKLVGRVVRSEELIENELYETAIGFEEIDKDDQASLYQFLQTFLRSPKKQT